MDIRDVAVSVVQRLTGAHIYRAMPRGLELRHDIANFLPGLHVEILFDVGANIGQSAQRYLAEFPGARLYCFEPVADTFRQLQTAVEGQPRVHCFQVALGAEPGRGTMVLSGDKSLMFHLASTAAGGGSPDGRTETVEVTTIDAFCAAHGIERVNYLKVDAEGADLDVLKGSEGLLSTQRIDLLELEAGLSPTNTLHVTWQAFAAHLEPRGYYLFGVYEQVPEWPTEHPHLRRANLAFISRRVSDANRGV